MRVAKYELSLVLYAPDELRGTRANLDQKCIVTGGGRRPLMICQLYSKLIAIKRWADRGLYDVVSENFSRLTNEDASIMLRILDHIHVVDRIFQHHLRGLPHTFQAPRSEKMPELQALAS